MQWSLVPQSGKGFWKVQATLLLSLLALVACSDRATQPVEAGTGPQPSLPPAKRAMLPTVKVASAVGWKTGETPEPAVGLAVTSFAAGLNHPRWLYVLPNGDVLVAETNAPAKSDDGGGLRAWLTDLAMQRAGANVPSANRITLLHDADHDGRAEERTVFLDGLNSPFGMALYGDSLYVAETDALRKVRYITGDRQPRGPLRTVANLPADPPNHHWTKNVTVSPDGRTLYVSVGSNSNIAEHGLEAEHERAAILAVDPVTGTRQVFASGLRNPIGLAWHPATGELWATVNERDELGSDLVPDYLTAVERNGFYGWPYSYFGSYIDTRVEPQRPDLVAKAIRPDYALGPHTASMGLDFARGEALPLRFRNGAFIGQHGSWNRNPLSGYKVIFVPFDDGRPKGEPIDVLTGFIDDMGRARGRPVGVAVEGNGAILVADDVGNVVWRVTRHDRTAPSRASTNAQ